MDCEKKSGEEIWLCNERQQSQGEIFEEDRALCCACQAQRDDFFLYVGRKQMLSMALLLVMFSGRRLPGLLLTVFLLWVSQAGQAVGTHCTHAGLLGSRGGVWQRTATEGKPTEVVLGAELKDSVNGIICQCKAFLNFASASTAVATGTAGCGHFWVSSSHQHRDTVCALLVALVSI